MPTSNLDSYLPNAYFYWIYNIFWIPLPLYGSGQMVRNFLFLLMYPLIIITSIPNEVLIWPLAVLISGKIFLETAIDKMF